MLVSNSNGKMSSWKDQGQMAEVLLYLVREAMLDFWIRQFLHHICPLVAWSAPILKSESESDSRLILVKFTKSHQLLYDTPSINAWSHLQALLNKWFALESRTFSSENINSFVVRNKFSAWKLHCCQDTIDLAWYSVPSNMATVLM